MTVFKIILVLFFLIPNILQAQLKQVNISKTLDEQKKLIQYGNTLDSFRFRFSTENQAVEIWTSDYLHFFGKFLNFTKTVNGNPDLFYCQISELDTITAKFVYNLFTRNNAFQIPAQDSIPGWESGLDGANYTIQVSSKTGYNSKAYWSPYAYEKIKEAKLLNTVYVQLYNALRFNKRWWDFVGLLPLGCYDSAGWEMTCTHKPKKKKSKKP